MNCKCVTVKSSFRQSLLQCLVAWLMVLFNLLSSFECVYAKKPPPLDVETQDLIACLSHKPELINLNYLRYYLGPPANERSQRARLAKSYFWYLSNGQLAFELNQKQEISGQTMESMFVIHLLNSQLKPVDVEKLYGTAPQHFYDYQSHATQLYCFHPNTYLSFTTPPNAFHVQEIKISYRGTALPSLKNEDFERAQSNLMHKASQLASVGLWDAAIPLLVMRLKEHPDDTEAHYQLARAYAKQGQIDEAIIEYKACLASINVPTATVGDNSANLKMQCIEGLQELSVLPKPPSLDGKHSSKATIKHNMR